MYLSITNTFYESRIIGIGKEMYKFFTPGKLSIF